MRIAKITPNYFQVESKLVPKLLQKRTKSMSECALEDVSEKVSKITEMLTTWDPEN